MVPPEKKCKASSSSKVDLISSLPETIREKILTYLPIKEAGRTSVLSSRWKYTWTSIRELKICEFSISTSLEKMVDAILLQHNGPILKFDLKTREQYSHDAFDRWISALSRNGIEELKLDFHFNSSRYKIHSSFFSCDNLTSVSLEKCSVILPVGFEGFKFLRILNFCYVSISDNCIKKLVSCCPVLENLELFLNGICTILDIQAPNLKYLYVCGFVKAFYLHAPNLLTRGGGPQLCDESDLHIQASQINLEQVLGGPNLELLSVQTYIMKCLTNLHYIGEFPMTFHNLKKLDIRFEDEKEAAVVLSLLQSTPNLEVLQTRIDINCTLWESMNGKDFALKRLRSVYISFGGDDMESVISFVKFVLDSAPELVELTIRDKYNDLEVDELDVVTCYKLVKCFKQLLKLRRASPKAQIIIK